MSVNVVSEPDKHVRTHTFNHNWSEKMLDKWAKTSHRTHSSQPEINLVQTLLVQISVGQVQYRISIMIKQC